MTDLYVVGFGFSSNYSHVVAIRKKRPPPIAGLLCGPGGLYEPNARDKGKGIFHAIASEFEEETGAHTEPEDWYYIRTIIGANGKPVALFWAENDVFLTARTKTDEPVSVLTCNEILQRQDTVEVFHEIVTMVVENRMPRLKKLEI